MVRITDGMRGGCCSIIYVQYSKIFFHNIMENHKGLQRTHLSTSARRPVTNTRNKSDSVDEYVYMK